MASATIEDESGRIQAVWFNQPYIAKMTPEGAYVRIEGKVSQRRNVERRVLSVEDHKNFQTMQPLHSTLHIPHSPLYFSNPKIEVVDKLPIGVGDSLFGDQSETHTMYPVYSESRGITSIWIYHAIQKLFKWFMLCIRFFIYLYCYHC